MNDAKRIDDVKAVIWKCQILRVAYGKLALEIIGAKSLACDFNAARSQIDAHHPGPAARKLDKVGSCSASNLQKPPVWIPVETDFVPHPISIYPVSVVFDPIEIWACSKSKLASNVRAAWVRSPLLAGPALIFVQHRPIASADLRLSRGLAVHLIWERLAHAWEAGSNSAGAQPARPRLDQCELQRL